MYKNVQFPFDKVIRRWSFSKWVLFKARTYGLINIRDSRRVCVPEGSGAREESDGTIQWSESPVSFEDSSIEEDS